MGGNDPTRRSRSSSDWRIFSNFSESSKSGFGMPDLRLAPTQLAEQSLETRVDCEYQRIRHFASS
jgi:hypothetical protein